MFPLVDNFEVEPIFEDRPHERHQFKLVIDGKKYKGDFYDGEIHWLHPHPKQVVPEHKLQAIENEVYELLGKHGISDDTDNMEVEPMLNNSNSRRNLQLFKLKIQGEEFKGTIIDGEVEWFHPKPRRKLQDERVEKIEEQIHEKMKEHME
ncbi:HicA family toxin-antitoxin system [Oceanobacillus alkalisoli]|uniref:HicA family toxin-antitoxin system n=1 Tax=Oceanobacillus alkalisoli TaxID=2925113 RepID=UPI001F11D74E|nr:HicA family toxin-antitoxin system [Oceanobacillus alkalisoli]MCF3944313.1 HicA family toxin-antitoxin system [Oceanobacillus alkalisoli]